jgi:Ser/Thr protein kinase RdoA (MazF antagonist)
VSIIKSTQEYEAWLTRYTPLVADDLETKHRLMSSGSFPFLRATFYRWLQCWKEMPDDVRKAPIVLGVGDIHVENFGTWRDAEGRLVWGVNDFDEACFAPYTLDLVRLIASAQMAIETTSLSLSPDEAGDAVLSGYAAQLESGGQPFVLSEQHAWLRPVAVSVLRDPVRYWNKMDALQLLNGDPPIGAAVALEHALPGGVSYTIHRRVAGVGSLGHMRFVALAQFKGGRIAREAKALVPSAMAWVSGAEASVEILYQAIVERAVRCRDPLVQVDGQWIVRRLSPDCSRIELAALPEERDEAHLLKAMGQELGNIHLGSREKPDARSRISEDLKRRKRRWYRPVVDEMIGHVKADFEKWKEHAASRAPAEPRAVKKHP